MWATRASGPWRSCGWRGTLRRPVRRAGAASRWPTRASRWRPGATMAEAPTDVAPPAGSGAEQALPAAVVEEPQPDPARLANMLQRLSEIAGDGQAAVSRLAFTPAEREAHATVARWLSATGLPVRTDA